LTQNRLAAAVLIVIFTVSVFGSCAPLSERHVDQTYEISVTQDDALTTGEGRVLRPALYFVQKGTGKLVAELRTIIVAIDDSPAKSIVKQLLMGPKDITLESVAPMSVSVDRVEISLDVANVYLRAPVSLTASERFIVKLALANTLTDYFSVKYVNVFYNGLADGFDGYPHPLQTKITGVWTEEYDDILGNHIAAAKDEGDQSMSLGIVLETPLYFFDASGEYLLPEVREVTYSGSDDYLTTIISELAKGPRNSFVYSSSVAKDLALSDTAPEWNRSEDGDTLMLDLKASPSLTIHDEKAYMALVYTLTSFFPNLKTVFFSVMGEPITASGEGYDLSDGITREEASGHLAAGIELFFCEKGENLLVKVNRMVDEDKVWSASGRLYELMKGPKSSESASAVLAPASVNRHWWSIFRPTSSFSAGTFRPIRKCS
jgi:hypothetical protein